MEESSEIVMKSIKKPTRRKYIFAAVIIFLSIFAGLIYMVMTSEQKSDPASEKVIREAVGKQLNKDPNSLSDEDFAIITYFEITNKELSDIRMLTKFRNLQNLRLVGIHFPALEIPKWMSLMEKLGFVNLKERFAIDLSPLENLTKLHTLTLSSMYANDIKTLANLKNLGLLYMSNTNVRDIKPLANLTNLKYLYLSSTNVSNIKPLANLKNLQELILSNTQVSDISVLENLTRLKMLNLSGTKVSDKQVEDLQKALPKLKIDR
jgi:internalin A